MTTLHRHRRSYTTAALAALSCICISQRATAQTLPPAAQVGTIAAHEICTAVADGRLNDHTTETDFEAVLQQLFARIEILYGPEMSTLLFNRLDTVFKSPGPPLDPYFMAVSQHFLRFVTTDTSCYNSLYTFISTPDQAPIDAPPVPDPTGLSSETEQGASETP